MTNTLAGYMLGQFSFAQYLEFLIRILVSCACGAAIGYERTKRLKEAGIRDHFKVMVGGGPLSKSFADKIGADAYTEDAASAAQKAKELVS